MENFKISANFVLKKYELDVPNFIKFIVTIVDIYACLYLIEAYSLNILNN